VSNPRTNGEGPNKRGKRKHSLPGVKRNGVRTASRAQGRGGTKKAQLTRQERELKKKMIKEKKR